MRLWPTPRTPLGKPTNDVATDCSGEDLPDAKFPLCHLSFLDGRPRYVAHLHRRAATSSNMATELSISATLRGLA
jgi:hypothetical protein